MRPIEEENKVIWIPCIKKASKICVDKPSIFSDLILESKDKKCRIESISEDSSFSFLSEYKENLSIKLSPQSNDIVIDDDFFIAIVHFNIVKKLSIPSIFTLVANKSDWIKS